MPLSINVEKNRVVRHGYLELAEHWALALSGLVLLLSGLFELPVAPRYKITAIPGFAWSGDFISSLLIHYVASVVFIVAAFFHLFYHGLLQDHGLIPRKGDLKASVAVIKTFFGKGEEPPFDKYLPEQRLAYLGMAVIMAVIIITGLIKTYKNIYAPDLSYTLVFWSTWLHNIFFILFILAFAGHIGAILLKPNRPMVRGIFTGAVRLDYARHRHPLWLSGTDTPAPPTPDAPADVSTEFPVSPGTSAETAPAMADDAPVDLSAGSPAAPDTGTIATEKTVKTNNAQGGHNESPREADK
ncbi:MAG: cytochrome b/b6 domain-containing protein [Thermodesulfobacteriota bacterium]